MKEIIFLDTNILNKQINFLGSTRELLVYQNTFKNVEVVIPKIVLDELVNHMEKEVETLNKNIDKINNLGQWVGHAPTRYFDIKSVKDKYRTQLKENFKVFEPKDEVYKKVFERYFKKHPPFHNGKQEFKDALIWETILHYKNEYGEKANFYFITGNSKDFSNVRSNTYELHCDLQKEFLNLTLVESIDLYLKKKNWYTKSDKTIDKKGMILKLEEYLSDHRWEFEEPLRKYIYEKNTDSSYEYISNGIVFEYSSIKFCEINVSEIYEHISIELNATMNLGKRTYFGEGFLEGEEDFYKKEKEKVKIKCTIITSKNMNEIIIIDDIKLEPL